MTAEHGYDFDVFLGYAPEDDEPVGDGKTPEVRREPLIPFFKQMLSRFAENRIGRELRIADAHEGIGPERAAGFIAIVSDRYVDDIDQMDRVDEYVVAREDDTSAMFAAALSPVPRDRLLDTLRDVRMYDLFGEDRRTLLPHVLRAANGLAKDLAAALEKLSQAEDTHGDSQDVAPPTVFLAHTDPSLRQKREDLRAALEARGFAVVPEGPAEADPSLVERETLAALPAATASIHLFTDRYDEAAWIECDVAMLEGSRKGDLIQHVWIAGPDEPANRVLANLFRDIEDAERGVALYRGMAFEKFQQDLVGALASGEPPSPRDEAEGQEPAGRRYVCLVYAEEDQDWSKQPRRYLQRHFGVLDLTSRSDETASEIGERLARHLSLSSGCLIVCGDATTDWLKETRLELVRLEKVENLDPPRGYCLVGRSNFVKREFRAEPGSIVIKKSDRVSESDLLPFIDRATGVAGQA